MLSNRRTVTVEWGDCDPNGIVFNANYYAWFDAALHGLLRSVGLSLPRLMQEEGVDGLPLAENHTRFLRPARPGDELTIETTVAAVHRCAFELQHRVLMGDALAVDYAETRVLTIFDAASGRIRAHPLPATMAALLSGGAAACLRA